MSEGTSVHQGKNEIIIVRRRSNGGDDHHSGAWKIAYADFMTAMMAFFLVMWLVNASNEETKLSVASYFNPIKLTDERPADRGIKQQGNSSLGEMTAPKSETEGEGDPGGAAKMGNPESTTAGENTDFSDADYFKDPYAVLAEIALETGTQTNISDAGEGGAATSGPATGATGGEAYRDPFDPDFWSKQIEADRQAVRESQALQQVAAEAVASEETAELKESARTADAQSGKVAASSDDAGTGPATAELKGKADELKADLVEVLGKGAIGKLAEGLTVTPSEGGLLISISDQLDFGMFRIGSAVPGPELVRAMDEIGKVLAARNGSIAIRGFTDARPFTNGSDDNWNLSMERAHSAYFMLVRGGVSEDRIVQLSGFADRRPKDPGNPFAEVNRRIEILLEAGEG